MLPKLEAPTFTLIVPSTKKKIKYRPFTTKESKAILLATNGSAEEILNAMKICVHTCTFDALDVETCPAFDLEYIFLQIVAKSSGEIIDLVLTCENCKEKDDYSLSIESVNVIHDPKHQKKIMIADNIGVMMKYPTTDQLEFLTLNYNTETVFNTVVDCIESIFDSKSVYHAKDVSREEIVEFMDSMTNNQMDMIENFFKTMPVLMHEFDHVCSKCGHSNHYKMQGLENFFG